MSETGRGDTVSSHLKAGANSGGDRARPAARDCQVTAYRDGPFLVRGTYRLVDRRGAEIPVRRRTVALCRCGRSRLAPFCDGTHKAAQFTAPHIADAAPPDGVEPRVTRPRAA